MKLSNVKYVGLLIALLLGNQVVSWAQDLVVRGTTTGNGAVYLATNNGNVGIGTTSPAYKLDINGSARATEGFKVPLYSAEQGSWAIPSCNATPYPVPSLVRTITVNVPSILDISSSALVQNNRQGGSFYTMIAIDGTIASVGGSALYSGCMNPNAPLIPGAWCPASGTYLKQVAPGTHTVQIYARCDAPEGVGELYTGFMTVRVYPQ